MSDKLKDSFAQSLGISKNADFTSLAYRQIPQWDSVAHMNLIAQLESDFNVMLSTDEVLAMSNFTKAKEILEKHGVQF